MADLPPADQVGAFIGGVVSGGTTVGLVGLLLAGYRSLVKDQASHWAEVVADLRADVAATDAKLGLCEEREASWQEERREMWQQIHQLQAQPPDAS